MGAVDDSDNQDALLLEIAHLEEIKASIRCQKTST